MDKLKKTAKGLDIVFTVLFWFMAAVAVLMLVCSIALAVLGAGEMSEMLAKAELSICGIQVDLLSEHIGEIGFNFPLIWITVAIGFVIVFAFACCGTWIIRRILKPMKEGLPFDGAVSGEFRKLGWLTILYGTLTVLFEMFGKNALMRNLITAGGTGSVPVAVTHEINFSFLLIAFLLFLFSYIFRYGEELQRLSDETL